MAEFRLERLTEYSDAEILSELRRAAALVDSPTLTIRNFRSHARVDYNTVRVRFRGWKEALEAAGLGHRYSGQSLGGRMRGPRPARGMSDAAILRELRALARGLGRDTLVMADFKSHPFLSAATVLRRFGRWRRAMARAGLRAGRYSGSWSEGECRENLLAVWTQLGRPPRFDEMKKPPSRIGPHCYARRWGSWRRALAGFVEWANGERESASGGANLKSISADAAALCLDSKSASGRASEVCLEQTAGASVEAQNQTGTAPTTPKPPQETTRHVPISLRFRILQRDRFRCTSCGNTPATDPHCRLHVDHVTPWSRGGRTEPGNLTTLCKVCNMGKGASSLQTPPHPEERALASVSKDAPVEG